MGYDEEKKITSIDNWGSLSHELKTPLHTIAGLLEIAASQKENQVLAQDCLKKAQESSQILLAVINSFFGAVKETKKEEKESSAFLMQEVINDIYVMLQPFVRQSDVEISIDEGLLKKKYFADKNSLIQMITTIILQMYKRAGERKLRVQLAMVKQKEDEDEAAVTICNGFDSIFSESILKIRLPYEMEDRREEKAFRTEEKKGSLKDKRILLVEDNEINAMITERILVHDGMYVDIARDGREGLELFEKSVPFHYDFILMDLLMPVMDGYQAAGAIRGLSRPDAERIPILAVSANAFQEDIDKAHSSGMNEHLSKPLNTKLLYQTMKKYL